MYATSPDAALLVGEADLLGDDTEAFAEAAG
jgi:hypothetical protein